MDVLRYQGANSCEISSKALKIQFIFQGSLTFIKHKHQNMQELLYLLRRHSELNSEIINPDRKKKQ